MRSVALLPAVSLVTGVCAGTAWARPTPWLPVATATLCALAAAAWTQRAARLALLLSLAGYLLAGAALGADAARDALDPPLRSVLDEAFGGFALAHPGPHSAHDPIPVRARLLEDAVPRDFGVSVRVAVESLAVGGRVRRVSGDARLAIAGPAATAGAAEWRAGRIIEAPVAFRRPARYLNEGVPDFERSQALGGVALAGSVKSGLVVSIVRPGNRFAEAAAAIRAHVRHAVGRRVADPLAAGIVTAILIGDRTGLPDDVRLRLQKAGTYHVIAISGGNIAILAAVVAGGLLLGGVTGRRAALVVMGALLVYSGVANAGPSVWRATATAVAYLAARLLDHRSPPWNAMAVSAAILACAAPPDVRDVGFVLSFGATAAILEAARRIRGPRHAAASWGVGIVVASLATEIVLLPIGAAAFSRVTIAGLALNLIAVPMMTIAQVAGLAIVCLDRVPGIGAAAGLAAGAAASALVESARLVDAVPWLALRVPAPAPLLICAYYAALGCALWLPGRRRRAAASTAICAAAMLLGAAPAVSLRPAAGQLRLTMLDVGQGEALLVQGPRGDALLVDAAGVGFDGGAFDIGGRVIAPALWARGVRSLSALAITHGDPDHIGGATAVLHDFAPAALWEGVPVPPHEPTRLLEAAARAKGVRREALRAGQRLDLGGVAIRVLHPPVPDWERQRVRNDDSLVLELRVGEVAMLLTGDVGAEVERALIPHLAPARVRVLKVAHHGSRTSTSRELLEAWRPQIALISCGRGNRFGHPAAEVLARLASAEVEVYRTDRDGQITVDTDGEEVSIRTYRAALR